MRTLSAAAAAVLLAACAASGVRVTSDQLASLRKGETTADEVLRTFGPPTTRTQTADGRLILIYSYAETKTRPATFVPVVGLFAGGADMRSSAAVLRFDSAGKLLDYTSSESQRGTGTGLAAGAVTAEPVPQPRQ